ncbi:MAG: hypothetical protein ACRDD1_11540, partial [Planctomycetia bacterium]
MRVESEEPVPAAWRGGVAAIGNFDGVHTGHRRLLALLRERAGVLGAPAVVLTFDPHPLELLRPGDAPAPLTRSDRKRELLLAAGADAVVLMHTTPALLDLTAEEFCRRIL